MESLGSTARVHRSTAGSGRTPTSHSQISSTGRCRPTARTQRTCSFACSKTKHRSASPSVISSSTRTWSVTPSCPTHCRSSRSPSSTCRCSRCPQRGRSLRRRRVGRGGRQCSQGRLTSLLYDKGHSTIAFRNKGSFDCDILRLSISRPGNVFSPSTESIKQQHKSVKVTAALREKEQRIDSS